MSPAAAPRWRRSPRQATTCCAAPRCRASSAWPASCSSPTRGGGEPMTALAVDDTDVRAAYRHCEQVTRTQARNFSYGIRLLPAPKRRALSAVYAFARRVDDIGDGTLPADEKLAALGEARPAVAAIDEAGARAAEGGPGAVAAPARPRPPPLPPAAV